MQSHAEFLRQVTGSVEWVEQLCQSWEEAELSPADRAMLEHVARLTRAPSQVAREDLDRLREVGFDDTAIFQITAIAAYFAYFNRMADGLGVGRG